MLLQMCHRIAELSMGELGVASTGGPRLPRHRSIALICLIRAVMAMRPEEKDSFRF